MTHKIEQDTLTLPASWASYLINGDESGMSDAAEVARMKAAEGDLENAGWRFASCDDEPRFTHRYRLYDPGAECTAGDVLEYMILRTARS